MQHNPLITIIADGWNREIFLDYLEKGFLPEISTDLMQDSILYKNVITVFPSVSLASHTSILTGTSQKDHKILCHRWFNKSSGIKNYVGIDTIRINEDISDSVQTIFEKTSHNHKYAIQSIISRGANKKDKYLSFSSSKIIKKATKFICKNPDSNSIIWLPNCDALSHKYGPHSIQVKEEMITVSKAIGVMIRKLKERNLFEDSKILFTSDHGFKEVSHRFNLKKLFKDSTYKVKINSKKFVEGVNIYTNGDSIALLYFNIPFKNDELIFKHALKMVESDGIDFIIQKLSGNNFKFISSKGVSALEVKSNKFASYKLETGEDPLQLLQPGNKEEIINYSEINPNTLDSKYPDLINQFLNSFLPESNIDLIITSKSKYHFGVAPRFGYRFGYHRGSHGGPSSDEMLFPAIIHSKNKKGISDFPIRSNSLLNILLN